MTKKRYILPTTRIEQIFSEGWLCALTGVTTETAAGDSDSNKNNPNPTIEGEGGGGPAAKGWNGDWDDWGWDIDSWLSEEE